MHRKDRSDDGRWSEPAFEPPPRVGRSVERRLAGRAAALWHECRGQAAMPGEIDYHAATCPMPLDDFTANSIMLGMRGENVTVDAVSREIAAAFGLECGRLARGRDSELAGRLTAAVDSLFARPTAIPFEGSLVAAGDDAATLLTRGVVLPLADAAGRVTAAHVVVTWKETLSPHASDRLRREIGLALGQSLHSGRNRDVFATPGTISRH